MDRGNKIYQGITVEIVKISALDVIKTSGQDIPEDEGGKWGPDI